MAFLSVIRDGEDEPRFTRQTVMRLARVSLELLEQCEAEELLRPRPLAGGGEGYSAADVRRMARIRRLQEDLGLDMAGVEVALHLRRQVLDLHAQLAEMEAHMRQQERQLLREIAALRRQMAHEGRWR